MSMEIYLAGKVNGGEIPIADFAKELESRGHVVLEKWWAKDTLPKPYLDHEVTSSIAADAMINAAFSSDVFILFPDDDILGAATELGAAIVSSKKNPDKQIVVVNPFEVRQSVFYVHPSVIAVKGLAQVRLMDWY